MKEMTRTILSKMNITLQEGDLHCTARITKHINIQAYIDGKVSYNLKFSDGDDLTEELNATQRAYDLFPNSVAKPEGIALFNECQVFVSQGISYTPLSRKLLRKGNQTLADGIVTFLTAKQSAPPPASTFHTYEIEDVIAHFRNENTLSHETINYLEQAAHLAHTLPPLLQQGDFALANIGLTATGLIIFDWEDYGKVNLPGFDLCVFICSFLKYSAADFRHQNKLKSFSMMQDIITRVCKSACFDERQFWKLVPLYLAVFAFLKETHGYGDVIRDRVLNALPGWIKNAN